MSNFEKIYNINVNGKTEKKNGLTYLSWAWAWGEFKKVCPDATYEVIKFDGKPYYYDPATGYMVYTTVTVDGLTHEMWLPVMDSSNKAMKAEPYTYKDRYGKERNVDAATMFDVNKTIMRCLVKNLAMFGLGLYIYAGEDLPEDEETKKGKAEEKPKEKTEEEKAQEEAEKLKKQIIDEKKVIALKEKAKSDGVDIEKLCKYAKVDDLAKLTEERFYEVCTHWTEEVIPKCKAE